MPRYVGIIVIILVSLNCVFGATPRVAFDCNRNGQTCSANGKCVTGPTCDCAAAAKPAEGFDCGIVTAEKGDAACSTASCSGNGQCVTPTGGTTTTCVCNENYYGGDCSLKRVDVKCIGDYMYLNMNTFGTFTGAAFVKGKREATSCVFKPTTDVIKTGSTPTVIDPWKGLALKLNLTDTACGDLAVPGATKTFQALFYIEYNKNFVTNKDELITAQCVFKSLNTIENTISGVVISDNLYKGASVDGNYDPVVFSIGQGDKAEPIPPTGLTIGTAISFTFNIPTTSGFTTLLVKSLKATDALLTTPKELIIITSGCPTSEGSTVIAQTFELDATKRTFSGKVSLFKFITSNNLLFVCEVLICDKTNAADCAINCPTARKKRAATSGKELTITKVVTVNDGLSAANNPGTENYVKDDCLQRPEVLVTIVTVSTFLVVLLVICLVLVCRMLTSPKKMPNNDVGSSNLSIPRASVSYF